MSKATRVRRIPRRLGWVYIAYHALVATVLVVSAFQELDPSYWWRAEFQLELLSVVLIYPALIPGLLMCGGLHDHCTSMLGHVLQLMGFLIGIAWYLAGGWVLATLGAGRFHRSNDV